MSASSRRLFSVSRTAKALSWAPCINCQSVSGMEGTFDSTRRAMTFAFAQSGSTAATRAMLARTAIIFDARSEPSAMVFIGIQIGFLCGLCVLCVSVVYCSQPIVNHRDTENTETSQRRIQISVITILTDLV